MKVLMLSTDQKIFDENSAAQQRMIDYGRLVDELHIVVYTNNESRIKNYELRASENVFVYPTKTRFKPFYFLDAYRLGKSIIENLKFKIGNCLVTSQDPFETGLVGYWLKRKFKIPLELQAHTDFLSPYFAKESLKNKIRVLLAKFLITRADRLRVVSERIKNSLLTLYPKSYTLNPIEVRPIFVDTEKIKKTPIKTDLHKKYPNHDFIILMASRLTKEKNIGMAIEAMKEIIGRKTLHPVPYTLNPLLLIVGDGPEYHNLESRIVNYELGNNVVIEPWTDDLISYYKTADLFLLTSNYEGYGRTAVEAQTAGVPVLMTDVGAAIGEILPVGDLEELVAKLSAKISKR